MIGKFVLQYAAFGCLLNPRQRVGFVTWRLWIAATMVTPVHMLAADPVHLPRSEALNLHQLEKMG
jgi:hypothetical protein